MKHFTRERYEACQHPDETVVADWEAQIALYRQHLDAIRGKLPASSLPLCDLTLHDGVVEALHRDRPDEVRLVVDASNNPWGPTGRYELRFSGVRDLTVTGPIVGDNWLYEEIHLDDAGFAYHVLLWRSELILTASDLALLPLDQPD